MLPPLGSRDPLDHLHPAEFETLRRDLFRLGRPLRTWSRVSSIRVRCESWAVDNLAEELESQGFTRTLAVAEACAHLDVALDTHLKRTARDRRDAFDPSRGRKDKMSLPEVDAA